MHTSEYCVLVTLLSLPRPLIPGTCHAEVTHSVYLSLWRSPVLILVSAGVNHKMYLSPLRSPMLGTYHTLVTAEVTHTAYWSLLSLLCASRCFGSPMLCTCHILVNAVVTHAVCLSLLGSSMLCTCQQMSPILGTCHCWGHHCVLDTSEVTLTVCLPLLILPILFTRHC